ncbi:hypothetical protein F4808DRAFT_380428 [Astrocystis sublimbata]|nr:hypothetical protein F4808DRAFT_380428 [Astrocystis sublimbata]
MIYIFIQLPCTHTDSAHEPYVSLLFIRIAMWYPTLLFLALPTDRSIGTCLLPGFDSPPSKHRPKFRYWLPDASVPPQSVTRDIDAIQTVVGGGIKFIPFYNYGLGHAITD